MSQYGCPSVMHALRGMNLGLLLLIWKNVQLFWKPRCAGAELRTVVGVHFNKNEDQEYAGMSVTVNKFWKCNDSD